MLNRRFLQPSNERRKPKVEKEELEAKYLLYVIK